MTTYDYVKNRRTGTYHLTSHTRIAGHTLCGQNVTVAAQRTLIDETPPGPVCEVCTVEAAWQPEFSPWRHGGWYVHNVRYASGACGCVSRNYTDRKWRIVCANQHDVTYPTRDAAARAERILAEASKA